jgi:2-amino-4-hydroxy-6-hydroxymethyldihydropteridine diphosphokinase
MSAVGTAAPALPAWAKVGEKRRAHIARVTALLESWGAAMRISADEARTWRDAGLLHDALRDAPESELRSLADHPGLPAEMLHGPAAAARLQAEGERRTDLLDAVRWHTVGHAGWARAGRALYMADFLEPGRKFSRADRAYLAAHVADDFDATFRQVVRMRIEWAVREGNAIYPETIALWDEVR